MTFKSVIEGLDPRAFRVKQMPRQIRSAIVYEQIARRRNEVADLPPIDLDALAGMVREISRTNRWDELDGKQLWHLPACLWSTKPPLASDTGFVRGYLRTLADRRSRIATKHLIFHYLLRFDPGAGESEVIGSHLANAVQNWEWDWKRRHARYGLFDASRGPRDVAQRALDDAQPRTVLNDAGLSGTLAVSGYALACFREAASQVQERLPRRLERDLIRRLVELIGEDPTGKFVMPLAGKYFADAVLIPWQSSDPSEELRDYIRATLLKFLSDPRVQPEEWNGVDSHAKAVMFRWLARASLEQFLAVVDQTAPGHQWEDRRAFWSAYIDRDYVSDSWVAFAPNGAARAGQLARERDDAGMLSFGALRGASADQAVLLLRIGDLIIADWSHNGSLRIWHNADPQAPKVHEHERRYQATELRTECAYSKRHVPGWQQSAESFIRAHTDIRLMTAEYYPRRRY
jgi:EH_Signature domain